ncbi:hypothetical protein R1flu_020182 [Riccia fluitans]|uniref:Uncharacterized protein n=1 Tax=Riccia fluitans TaxID=41844 RepID=A0ABD1ZPM2_9MARC
MLIGREERKKKGEDRLVAFLPRGGRTEGGLRWSLLLVLKPEKRILLSSSKVEGAEGGGTDPFAAPCARSGVFLSAARSKERSEDPRSSCRRIETSFAVRFLTRQEEVRLEAGKWFRCENIFHSFTFGTPFGRSRSAKALPAYSVGEC